MSKIYYSSDEMFSSTDLIRKSKPIFDLVAKKTIDKAVILRDGKPSFILLDFLEYEKLMKDYLSLKEQNSSTKKGIENQAQKTDEIVESEVESQLTKSMKMNTNKHWPKLII